MERKPNERKGKKTTATAAAGEGRKAVTFGPLCYVIIQLSEAVRYVGNVTCTDTRLMNMTNLATP